MDVRELESPAELSRALEVHHRSFVDAFEGLLPGSVLEGFTDPPGTEEVEERFDRITDQPGCFLLARRDGRVLGYAWFRWGEETKAFVDDDEAGLKEIYVDPDHWGEGVGTALLEAGLDRLPDGSTAVSLEALSENETGRRFYEAHGFEAVDTFVERVEGEEIEHTVFRKPLE